MTEQIEFAEEDMFDVQPELATQNKFPVQEKDSNGNLEDQIARTLSKERSRELAYGYVSSEQQYSAYSLNTEQPSYFSKQMPTSIDLIGKLRLSFLPEGRLAVTKLSYEWYDRDDLLGSLIDLKVDFCTSGFLITGLETDESSYTLTEGSEDSYTEHDKNVSILQDNLDAISLKFKFKKIVKQLVKDYFISDSMILYWHVDTITGEVTEVNALDPRTLEYDDSFDNDILTVKIPDEIIRRINTALSLETSRKSKAIQQLLNEGVLQKMIDAVKDGKRSIELNNDEGDFWIVSTVARKHCGLATPRMRRIFLSLASRLVMTEGDFSAAIMMKHFIFHISEGETAKDGPDAGTKSLWITPEAAEQLTNLFKGVNKTTVFATDHTVKMSFIFPPKELFDETKYIKLENRILGWTGVSRTIFDGTEGKYSGAYISIRRLISNLNDARDEIGDMLKKFFQHESTVNLVEKVDGIIIGCGFDSQLLKEPRQVLDEVTALLDRDMHDPEAALLELGRDPARIKRGRRSAKLENEELETWKPINEEDGMLNDSEKKYDNVNTGKPGRPTSDPERELNEDTRNQYPAAS